jgi:fucose 4-O-acetylase-like acetyltransferase
MPARQLHVDIARGIGIALVVLGHNPTINADPGITYRVIYSFHMPLFFFLSGMFLRPDMPIGEWAIDRAESLLKPYLVTTMLWAPWFVIALDNSMLGYVARALYGSGRAVPVIGLWFLPHLFVLSLFSWLVVRHARSRAWPPEYVAALLLGSIVVGSAFGRFFMELPWQGRIISTPGLPWGIDLVVLTAPFFLSGYYLRDRVLRMQGAWPALLVGISLLAFCHTVDVNQMGLAGRRYGNPVFATLAAAGGICAVLGASRLLATAGGALAPMLAYLGAGSLFVLLFHGIAQGIAMDAAEPYGLPIEVPAAIGLVAGCALPLVLGEIVRRHRPLSWLFLSRR